MPTALLIIIVTLHTAGDDAQSSKPAAAAGGGAAQRTVVVPRFKLLPFNMPATGSSAAQLKRGDLVEFAVTFVTTAQSNGRGGRGGRGRGSSGATTTVMHAVKLSKLQAAAVPSLRGIVTEVRYTTIQLYCAQCCSVLIQVLKCSAACAL
jgi:hypothetical protein